jgi:hypothetical protein
MCKTSTANLCKSFHLITKIGILKGGGEEENWQQNNKKVNHLPLR